MSYTSTILITGGTQGLGFHCALALARHKPDSLIVIASRTDPANAALTINTQLKQQNVRFVPLDLSSLASVRSFAQTFLADTQLPLAALVLNAGIQLPGPVSYTTDGIEKHFGINHVAHALLFHLLALRLAPDARIITVSSGLHDPVEAKTFGGSIMPHYTTPALAAHPDAAALKESNGRDRYATSKTANAIWSAALASHLPPDSSKTVVAFDPGLMFGTNFTRDANFVLRFLGRWILPHLVPLARLLVHSNINPPEESGGNMAWLVTSGEVKGKKGEYYEKRREKEASAQARSREKQDELWEWTLETVTCGEEERGRFERVE